MVALPTGVEPVTFWLTAKRSNQLSYGSFLKKWMTEHPLYETYKGYNILNILFFQFLRTRTRFIIYFPVSFFS
jgi:hypothetical protein